MISNEQVNALDLKSAWALYGSWLDTDYGSISTLPKSALMGLGAQVASNPANGMSSEQYQRKRLESQKDINLASKRGSRKFAEIMAGALPEAIRIGLANGAYRFADYSATTYRSIAAVATAKLFLPQDVIDDTRNVDGGKLNKTTFLMVDKIILQYGTGASIDLVRFGLKDNIAAGTPQNLSYPSAVANGWFDFIYASNRLFNRQPLALFDKIDQETGVVGLHRLDNPFWLLPELPINFDVNFTAAAAANSWLKLTLTGTAVVLA